MKRTMITIGAVLYLAACWAPQLWTGTADAQEKPDEPAVLEEVRARRFVLVDAEGAERAVLEMEGANATLSFPHESPGERSTVGIGTFGLVVGHEAQQQDETWMDTGAVTVSASPDLGASVAIAHHTGAPGIARTTVIAASGVSVVSVDSETLSAVSSSGTRLSATNLEFITDGTVRASIGQMTRPSAPSDTNTTQEGAFVSYDADGNVLWMEPK